MFYNIIIFCISFSISFFIMKLILNYRRGRVTIYCEKNRTKFSEKEYEEFLKMENEQLEKIISLLEKIEKDIREIKSSGNSPVHGPLVIPPVSF